MRVQAQWASLAICSMDCHRWMPPASPTLILERVAGCREVILSAIAVTICMASRHNSGNRPDCKIYCPRLAVILARLFQRLDNPCKTHNLDRVWANRSPDGSSKEINSDRHWSIKNTNSDRSINSTHLTPCFRLWVRATRSRTPDKSAFHKQRYNK